MKTEVPWTVATTFQDIKLTISTAMYKLSVKVGLIYKQADGSHDSPQ